MDWVTATVGIIVIVLGTIVVQYLLNPYFHKLGLHKREEEREEKTEEKKKKEEEFYREIWRGKKRS